MNEVLTIKEASKYLDISERTIRRKIKSGQLLSILSNGKYLINKEDLDIFKKDLSTRSGQVDNIVKQFIREISDLRSKIEQLTEENKDLKIEVKKTREESRQLSAIVFDLSEKLIKALPPPKPKKRWWEFWKQQQRG